jgi:SAM-dependent methyltransferase
MSFDAADHRRRSSEAWDAAASGWAQRQEMLREVGAPVSDAMLAALQLAPGERVLELAGGLGESGMLAAERVAPGGEVVLSDRSDAMLDGARARAAELGLANVSFRVIDAESIDIDAASFDAVLCRWGYMLMADPGAALSETRRVLRPGGRLALAVWDTLDTNPWAALPGAELREHAPAGDVGSGRVMAAPGPGPAGEREPGPFTLADRAELTELIEAAGFTGVAIEAVDVRRRHPGFTDFWDATLDMSRAFHDAVMELSQEQIDAVRAGLEQRFAPYTDGAGSLEIPGRALVAAADA